MRDRLARSIDVCDSMRDLATLSEKLSNILSAIAELPEGREASAADEIAARRATRRSGTKRPARSERSS